MPKFLALRSLAHIINGWLDVDFGKWKIKGESKGFYPSFPLPSFIAMVRSEAKGFEVLLHVTNPTLNALISSSYLWIDTFSSPSNHLTVIGPTWKGKSYTSKLCF